MHFEKRFDTRIVVVVEEGRAVGSSARRSPVVVQL